MQLFPAIQRPWLSELGQAANRADGQSLRCQDSRLGPTPKIRLRLDMFLSAAAEHFYE